VALVRERKEGNIMRTRT